MAFICLLRPRQGHETDRLLPATNEKEELFPVCIFLAQPVGCYSHQVIVFLHGGAFQVGSSEAALYGPQVTFEVLPLSLLGTAGSLRCPSRSELQIGSLWLVIPGL